MANAKSHAAHVSARVRGMKSHLLDTTDLDSLLESAGPEAMAEMLLTTPYETEMAEALTRYQGADAVEDGVTRNLINSFTKLRKMCDGELAELVGVFFTRWDLNAVKSLLRNRHHGLDAESGEASLLTSPSISPALINDLASRDTIEELVRGLIAWNSSLCRPLERHLTAYSESRNLRVLEDALDKAYFVSTLSSLESNKSVNAQFVREVLRLEIDRMNLRRLFEPRGTDMDAEDVLSELLPSGALSQDTLRAIASSSSPERAAEQLETTTYSGLGEALKAFSQTGHFSRLERAFDLLMLAKLKRASLQGSLSIAVLMRFAWLKYNEVMNIRMISRGASVHLPKSRIQEEVLYA